MVLPFGILDGLPHALRGLGRMAFQPEVTGEANADQNMVIQPEIDLARLPRMGPVAERSLELDAEAPCSPTNWSARPRMEFAKAIAGEHSAVPSTARLSCA